MSESDDLLLVRLRGQDPSAFETLFQRHYGSVFRILCGLLGSREEAEDVTQETFLALYRRPPRPGDGGGLAAWLRRVALNRGYNALRSARRGRERLEGLAWAGGLEAPVDPQAETLRSDERAEVRAILMRLPERQGRLLLLRHAGLSYQEVAAVLEVAPGSVGTLLARAERAFLAEYRRRNRPECDGSFSLRRL